MTSTVSRLLTETANKTLREHVGRIESCVGRLAEDQIWARDSDNANSIGNLMLHLAGNVRQWIVSGLGGSPDARNRDAEFAARGGTAAQDLLQCLKTAIEEAAGIIQALDDERLIRTYAIQEVYHVSGVEALVHVVEHFGQHTGQIVFATKLLTGEDLGFYKHLSSRTNPKG